MTHPPAPRRGLSLIEVLLALAIMLLSLGAIGQLVDFGSARGMEARLNTLGARLVRSKMGEVEAGLIPVTGSASGQFDDQPEWSWAVDPQAQGTPNLYLVTVKVTRDLRGRPFEVTLSQMLLDPAQTGSAAQAQTSDSSATGTTGTTSGSTSP